MSRYSPEYHHQHYLKNRERYFLQAKAKKERMRTLLDQVRGIGCFVCGIKDLCVLDFHHARGVKVFNLSTAHRRTTTAVEAELKKCDVLCANCHRKVHCER